MKDLYTPPWENPKSYEPEPEGKPVRNWLIVGVMVLGAVVCIVLAVLVR